MICQSIIADFLLENKLAPFQGLAPIQGATSQAKAKFLSMLGEEVFRFDQYPAIAMILRAVALETRGMDLSAKRTASSRFRFAVCSQPHLPIKSVGITDLDAALNGVVVGPEPAGYQEVNRQEGYSMRVWPEIKARSVTVESSQALYDLFDMDSPACIYTRRSLTTRFRDEAGELIERPTGILSVRERNFNPTEEIISLQHPGRPPIPRYGFVHPLCSWSVWVMATPNGKEVDPAEFPRLAGLDLSTGDIWVVLEFTAATMAATPEELLLAASSENEVISDTQLVPDLEGMSVGVGL